MVKNYSFCHNNNNNNHTKKYCELNKNFKINSLKRIRLVRN